ncbi:MAG: YbaB/EbfC family nucleoid-associated protein [Mycoplasmataceae bacterium]|jgi:DNA-binding YbaB/EbfC family protein|nr:YbaB/EbfC family nucleoid-associated protein [Mycoplasmataceae bacterium]
MNINQMMQQAQKMQKEIQKKLEEFDNKEFEFDYKNGSVVVNMGGNGRVTKLVVNQTLVDPEDKITMEEMIAEAINQAYDSIQEDRDAIQQSSMPKGGMPGMGF